MTSNDLAPGDPREDESLIARVRARVLAAVGAERPLSHRTVRASSEWELLCPGIERKVLWDADGARSVMMRFAPGVTVPGHVHAMDEECVVLQGTVRIGDLELHAGDFHVGSRGSVHDVSTTETGAVVYLRGAIDAL